MSLGSFKLHGIGLACQTYQARGARHGWDGVMNTPNPQD
jgi:hypothetical protein